MNPARKPLTLVLLFAILACSACQKSAQAGSRIGTFFVIFGGPSLTPKRLSSHVAYNLDPTKERYLVHVPTGYSGKDSYGLIVFIDASDELNSLPAGWEAALDVRKYIFVAAQNSGNDQARGRRLGLAVLGALEVAKQYRIDPNRVFVAGFSGGARMAGMLGFYQSDLFRGTIQNCGADFYRSVPIALATSQVDTVGKPYGLLEASQEDVVAAKQVRFALVTGSGDFRRGNILDIFHGGFKRDGFQAELFDVPGMGHDICRGETLIRILDFLEDRP
jgi:hypothetical protein